MSLETLYQQFIFKSRYARWNEEEGRREDWPEAVKRYNDYVWNKAAEKSNKTIDQLSFEIGSKPEDTYSAIYNLEVMPSMRALLTAGPALDRDNAAGYNCSYKAVDEITAFDEIMYNLLVGAGVGFSVERQYIANLPTVGADLNVNDYLNFPGVPEEELSYQAGDIIKITDSKYGWASALRILILNLFSGNFDITWDTSKIRPAGSVLKTFGGRASGPEPLEECFEFIKEIMSRAYAEQRKLTSIECHDIVCKVASIVVVGGVRRCLPENSSVQTNDGWKTIKNLSKGDTICSLGEEAKVLDKVYSGEQKLIDIEHDFGTFSCTKEHQVAVLKTPEEIVYKRAKDLTEQDVLAFDSCGYDGEKQNLPSFTEKLHPNAKKFSIPELNTDVAWLLGFIHGDGYIGPKSVEINSNSNDRLLLELANKVFSNNFGLDGKISQGNGDNCIRLRINSAPLARYFQQHLKQSNSDIKIPKYIKSNTREIRASYLAGLYDADGRCRNDGVIEQVTSVYPSLISDVENLLIGLGIYFKTCNISTQKRRDSGVNCKDFSSIYVRGNTNRLNWYYKIGKYIKSIKFPNETNIGSTSSTDFKYPANMFGNIHGWKKDSYITYLSALDKKLVSDTSFKPVPIKKIYESSEEDTYDIEVENINRFTADGLVVHNSALISLSNLSDDRMRYAKFGKWDETEPQRALSNNSACYTETPDVGAFMREFLSIYESKSGERGIFSREAAQKQAAKNGRRDATQVVGTNPCSEILLRNNEFCNLTEAVIRADDTHGNIRRKVKIATVLGTFQSLLTDFVYLNPKWKENCEEERLLGVSLTGIMDHETYGDCNNKVLPELLSDLREATIYKNTKVAKALGINESAAITCVKPSGTVSQLVNSSSGIHPRYAKRYIRAVRNDIKDPVSELLIEHGVYYEVDRSNSSNYIFYFPVEAPESCKTTEDISALEQLKLWDIYAEYWCEHKPSVTIHLKDKEWPEVCGFVYRNFDKMSGIAFLPYNGHVYKQAPYQEASDSYFRDLIDYNPEVIEWDHLTLYESEDETKSAQELACSAGVCEI